MSGFTTETVELFAAETVLAHTADEARATLAQVTRAGEDVLGHGWTGTAATAFGAGWHDWLDAARCVLSALEQMGNSFAATACTYEAAEASTVQVLGRIA